jgi:hypothetical protein
MKNCLLTMTLVIMSCFAMAQQIPNNGFESWVSFGDFENPEHWDTGNQTVLGVSIITTTKTGSSHSGNWAAQMETINFLTFTVPGLVTLGDFEVDIWSQQFSITGGIPFDEKPHRINLYYTYNPAPGDKMNIGVWLLANTANPVPDTVGIALYESDIAVNDYTLLSLDINYLSEETPELLNIVAVSSSPDNPTAGSVLRIDDLEFDYATAIKDNAVDQSLIYPNPTADFFNINTNVAGSYAEIINQFGQQVKRVQFGDDTGVNISDLPAGIYVISFTEEVTGRRINQKLIKY